MSQTMRALVKREAAEGIWMEDVPIPQAGTNEVLIKVEKTAICGTDVHIYNWDEWSQRTIKPGLVIGHEFVGRIVELGDGVTGYKLGDRVSQKAILFAGIVETAVPASAICARTPLVSALTAMVLLLNILSSPRPICGRFQMKSRRNWQHFLTRLAMQPIVPCSLTWSVKTS